MTGDGRVIGLDLSLTAPGLALPDGSMFTIKPRGKGDWRLVEIEGQLIYYLDAQPPQLAVIEEIPTAGINFQTAIILALVHGIARTELARRRIPFAYIGTTKLKKYATATGAATKQQMIEAAENLGAAPADDNQADAWWLRGAGRHWLDGTAPSIIHILAADLIMGPKSTVVWPDRDRCQAVPGRATG